MGWQTTQFQKINPNEYKPIAGISLPFARHFSRLAHIQKQPERQVNRNINLNQANIIERNKKKYHKSSQETRYTNFNKAAINIRSQLKQKKARKQGSDTSKMLKDRTENLEFYPSKLKVK